MWKAVGTSIAGTSHTNGNVPCQDYSDYLRCRIGDDSVLIVGISDGAGSAALSHIGSHEVIGVLLQKATSCNSDIADIQQENIQGWFSDALAHLKEVAEREKIATRELACTALLAILGDRHSVFAQIGDGAWIAEANGIIGAVTWPQTGEFANETNFITSPDAIDSMQFQKCGHSLTAVAGFSDGIQTLALNIGMRTAHAPFFEPMFGALKDCDDETTLLAPLIAFLSSNRVNERTDDDKTLVIACRSDSVSPSNELA